jgi:hypothetical protein
MLQITCPYDSNGETKKIRSRFTIVRDQILQIPRFCIRFTIRIVLALQDTTCNWYFIGPDPDRKKSPLTKKGGYIVFHTPVWTKLHLPCLITGKLSSGK